MPIKPLQNVIIVKPTTVSDTTPGGIVIPAKSILKTREGTVVAVGPGCTNKRTGRFRPMELAEGDYILFEASHGVRMDYMGEKLIVMRDVDVQMVMDRPQGNTYDPTPYYEQGEIRVAPPVCI